MLQVKPYLLGIATVVTALAALVAVLNSQNAAPAISGNASLNRKAEYLRAHQPLCDLVVLGSSTALNNIDAGLLGRRMGHRGANLGYWGAAPSESLAMFRELARDCTPRIIVMPLQFYDLYAAWNSDAEIEQVFTYARNRNALAVGALYIAKLLPTIREYFGRSARDDVERTDYQSLAFGPSGDVLLDCSGFHYDAVRWDGYRKITDRDFEGKRMPEELQALDDLLHLARSRGTQAVLVRPPLRVPAERAMKTVPVDWVWEQVARSARETGALFLFVKNDGQFGDDQFVDYSHLNRCGARALTAVVADRMRVALNAGRADGYAQARSGTRSLSVVPPRLP
jgi:hypothetical protein